MAWPARDDPNYQAHKDAYNARRKKRRAAPEYRERERERWAAQKERRERRRGKEG